MLPEKALKGQALSHNTRYELSNVVIYLSAKCNGSLGMPEFMSPCGVWSGCEYLDEKDKPFVVFNFKYRSRSAYPLRIRSVFNANVYDTSEALQDLRIIQRPPTPLPLEERPIEQLTGDQALELLRRQRVGLRLQSKTHQTGAKIV